MSAVPATILLILCVLGMPAFSAEYALDEDSVVILPNDVSDASVDLVFAPIPIANPTIGSGLAVVGLALYKLDSTSPASSTAIAAGYTDTDSWGLGVLQEANFSADTWRLSAGLAVALARYDLYMPGVSPDFHFTTEQRVSGGWRRCSGESLHASMRACDFKELE